MISEQINAQSFTYAECKQCETLAGERQIEHGPNLHRKKVQIKKIRLLKQRRELQI